MVYNRFLFSARVRAAFWEHTLMTQARISAHQQGSQIKRVKPDLQSLLNQEAKGFYFTTLVHFTGNGYCLSLSGEV